MRARTFAAQWSRWMGPALVRLFVVLAGVALLPSLAHAQSSIAGIVRDASGAVSAGSHRRSGQPRAHREGTRTTVSDGTGQYRLTDLLPGTYTLTFTLTGFAAVKRDGVQMTGAGVITINADMQVGDLQETITVTGETPIVDVQSTRRQQNDLRRDLEGDTGDPRLQRPYLPGALGQRWQQPDRPDAGHAHLHQPRRARQRRAHPRGRPEHGVGLQRRWRLRVHHRHRQRAGNAADAVGRPRGERDGRHVGQLRPQDRRQHLQRPGLLQHGRPVVPGQQHRCRV